MEDTLLFDPRLDLGGDVITQFGHGAVLRCGQTAVCQYGLRVPVHPAVLCLTHCRILHYVVLWKEKKGSFVQIKVGQRWL